MCTELNLDTHTNFISGFHHFACILSKPDPSGTDRALAALANEKLLVAAKVTDATGTGTLDGPSENIVPWQSWETW